MVVTVIIFKGIFNPIPDIFYIKIAEDSFDPSLFSKWEDMNPLIFHTTSNKIRVYGAGQIRKIICKPKGRFF